jgi:hypothetical protein
MSESSPSAPGKAGPPKEPVSPVRNIIGLIVLVAVVVIGYFEVSAKFGYEAAVKAVDKRLQDEDHGLPEQPEAEKLIGKSADDAGSEVQEGSLRLTKKTYTWKGLFSTYTLAAYYTKSTRGAEPALHHIEAGEKFQPQAPPAPEASDTSAPPKAETKEKRQRIEGKGKGQPKAEGKAEAATDETPPPPPPEEKAKAAADEPKPPDSKPEEKAKAADEKPKSD